MCTVLLLMSALIENGMGLDLSLNYLRLRYIVLCNDAPMTISIFLLTFFLVMLYNIGSHKLIRGSKSVCVLGFWKLFP